MDFTHKARLVAGGHLPEAPDTVTYSSVVSMDLVRLAFLIVELNHLEILACDIENPSLNAPCRERIWFLGGAEVGTEQQGKVLVMVKALYGLKSSGASWRATLADHLSSMGFQGSRADPNVWRREAKRDTGKTYYELLVVYVDNILAISQRPRPILKEISEKYKIKNNKIEPPDLCLGAKIYKLGLREGGWAWGMSSEKYVKNVVKTVKDLLQDDRDAEHLKTKAKVPVPTNYKPELDATKHLLDDMISRYQQLIGILRWAVELGRLDVYHEGAIMSQYLASPRIGHLQRVYHIFAYLKMHQKMKIVFDPKDVAIDESQFHETRSWDWSNFFGNVVEEIPADMPTPMGKGVKITCFVDADHAGNIITRRGHIQGF